MERIEFEMKLKQGHFERAVMKRLLISRFPRIYYLVLLVIIVTIVAISPDISGVYEAALAIGTLVAVVIPFAVCRGYGQSSFRLFQKYGRMLFFLDQGGYGGKSDVYEFYIKWKGINRVYETTKYIFVRLNTGRHLTIYKSVLPDETVLSIKQILACAPISEKKLIP